MRALSLWQPWATLIALGVKTIETRHWPAPKSLIGERIAIHAAKKSPRRLAHDPEGMLGSWWVVDDGGWIALLDHRPGRGGPVDLHDLPLGAIVATAKLAACVPMVPMPRYEAETDYGYGTDEIPEGLCVGENRLWLDGADYSDQLPFGWFEPGRWAWILDQIVPLPKPLPAKGAQGVWNWEGCPNDTDGDGNCGRRLCPFCGGGPR